MGQSDTWEIAWRGMIGDMPHVGLAGPIGGVKALVLTPDPDHPYFASRPGWRRIAQGRLRCYVDGRCPECGAVFRAPNRAERRRYAKQEPLTAKHGVMEHEADCALSDDAVALFAKAERQ